MGQTDELQIEHLFAVRLDSRMPLDSAACNKDCFPAVGRPPTADCLVCHLKETVVSHVGQGLAVVEEFFVG